MNRGRRIEHTDEDTPVRDNTATPDPPFPVQE